MFAMRGALPAVSVAVATVMGASGGAGAVGPEADVSHHGRFFYGDGQLDVVLLSENHGPSPLEDATVRLAFSSPLAAVHDLSAGCVWGGDREVLCSTGPLGVDGARRETILALRTAGAPQEVTVRVTTAWNGGATDRNPANNDHRVLVLATGDPYVF
ncbi:hypothetical protein QWM81_16395 [Streptomyces ficellus]|uniref:DUF11 domain-containing protein n=1 Tax=Streptomyces ficellus TaxID=1977088 RepID=A0ABT7Z7X6_9ACTN|nr:hypothetical protein [Streptomyces ficellus]MDN3295603.1 hypothetical protein [Streptomyces ficellus]